MSTFEEVVQACGLPAMMGPSLVKRALEEAGVSSREPSAADIRRAFPQLQKRLAVYVGAAVAAERMEAVRRVVEGVRT